MPAFLLLGAVFLGGMYLARGKKKRLSIEEAARAPTPALVAGVEDEDERGGGDEPSVFGCFATAETQQNHPQEQERSRARVQLALQKSQLVDDEEEADEDELIFAGRPSLVLRRGSASLTKDAVVAAWLFEERPSLPPGPVYAILPKSASAHLYVIAESYLGWMYVFEKWKDGVCVARFRDPTHAKDCRAGFTGHFRRRKQVRQLSSISPPVNTSPAHPLMVADLLLWSAQHSEFRQFTDNCHTYAVNLAIHLGMQPPKDVWEDLLYNTY